MRFINFVRKHWIVASLLVVIALATGFGVMKVLADSSVTVSASPDSIIFTTMDDVSQITFRMNEQQIDPGVNFKNWNFSIDNSAVATYTINDQGSFNATLNVMPISAGTTTLTATYNLSDGSSFSKEVSIYVPLLITQSTGVSGIMKEGNTGSVTVNSPNVTWTSSPGGIVEIDSTTSTGTTSTVYVHASHGGVASLIATTPTNLSATYDVTVGVSIDPVGSGALTDSGGSPYILVEQGNVATIATNSTASQAVFWWSADPTIATVDDAGNVTGIYAGETYIYASCVQNSIENDAGERIRVVVPYTVNDPSSSTVMLGDQISFNTSANPSNLTYASDDMTIVTFDAATGLFKAVGIGTTNIYVKVKNSADDAHMFTVTVIDGISLSTTGVSLNIGDKMDIKATVTNYDSPVIWSVSDSTVASYTVADDGLTVTVEGLATGKTSLIATQEIGGVIKTCICDIYVMNPVTNLTLLYNGMAITDTISVPKGNSLYITAYLNLNDTAPDNTKLSWVSSDESVIRVTPSETTGQQQLCLISAVGGGNATITVVSDDGLLIRTANFYVTEGVTSITLDKTEVTAQMALEKYQLTASILPNVDGVDQTVIWASLDPKVITVDQNGLVTFVAPGETYISATSAADTSKVAYCKFVITQQVEDVTMDYKTVTLNVGDEYRLTALITPANATNKNVTWSSSNEKVVKVDKTGMLTAVGSGSATIVVQTEDGGYIDMTNVTVLQPVTSITLSASEMTVKKGTVFWLNATVNPETADNKKVIWTSSDTSLATVDQTGMVTTLAVGTVTISCVSEDNSTIAYCVVEITEPVTGLILNSYYQELVKGTKFVIVPNVLPIDALDKSCTFLSSDESVATVDENGIVTAVAGGTCEILVTTNESSLKQTCTIVVKEFVESIEITGAKDLLNVKDSLQLGAIVKTDTATDKGIIWSSSNLGVATVDQKGKVTGISEGNVVITAVAADGSGVSDAVAIRIINPVTSITLSDSKITIYVGDTYNISATVGPDNASIKTLEWVSDDESIAKVYQDGDVVGISAGRTVVKAISTDGNDVVATCTVIVKNPVYANRITINSSDIIMLKGKTRQLLARIYPTNTNEAIHWLSTDTSVVTVDQKGNIITVGAGEAQIIAYSTYGTVEDSCTIHSIAMSCTSLKMEQYDTFNLYVDGAPRAVSWRSSNPRIASVNANGVVTGRMPGECVITATIDGKTVTCNVKIYAVDPGKFINVR